MKKFLLLAASLLFTTYYSYSQDCTDCRYVASIFDSVIVETVAFGEGLTIDDTLQVLKMDIYRPYGDTVTNRPVMIFAFGGAFVTGERDDWYVQEACNLFAKAGYVAVAPDYRVGIDYGEIFALQHMRIFFRPMQDVRACVQYLKADFSELGNNYSIDTNRIIIGGASSGGITALMVAYCDKESEMAQMGDISALDSLGGFYSTTGYYPNYSWKGIATVNVSGAMIDAGWIEAGDVPIISAHGNIDDVVPYAGGSLGGITFGLFDLEGSYLVDSAATSKGVCSYLYTMEGQGHPSESMGIEYIRSVVYRLALQAHAVVMGRSFCCPLNVDIEGDTLFHWTDQPPVPATLIASVANDNGNAVLQWCSLPCEFTGNADEITFQPDTNLKYVAAMAYEGGCESSDLYIVTDTAFVPQAINEYFINIDFSVYPQPAASQLTVRIEELNKYTGKPIIIELFNIKGQRVFAQQYASSKDLQAVIDITGFSAGNYAMRLKSGNEVLGVKKIMITH